MAIKYNPYNWEIRPRKSNDEPEIIFDIDIDEEMVIEAILGSIEVSIRKISE